MLAPEITYSVLLVVQALHLLHHRLAKRHISFVEVTAGAVLCISPGAEVPAAIFMTVHLVLAGIQIVGSIWIDKLSPTHNGPGTSARLG